MEFGALRASLTANGTSSWSLDIYGPQGFAGPVVGQYALSIGSMGGGGGGASASTTSHSPAYPTWAWGSESYHYDFSTYEFNSWSNGDFYSADWHGVGYSYDFTRSWSPWDVTTTMSLDTTEYWGNSFSSPNYFSSFNHSETRSTDSLTSSSPWSFLEMHDDSIRFVDSNYWADQHSSGSSTRIEEHSRSDMISVSPGSLTIQNTQSDDLFDFSHFQSLNLVNDLQYETHRDMIDVSWRSGNASGEWTDVSGSSHQQSTLAFGDYVETDVANSSFREYSSVTQSFGGFGIEQMMAAPVEHHDWMLA